MLNTIISAISQRLFNRAKKVSSEVLDKSIPSGYTRTQAEKLAMIEYLRGQVRRQVPPADLLDCLTALHAIQTQWGLGM